MTSLNLPKLKTRQQLLEAAPQLARFLAEDGDAGAPLKIRPRSPSGKLRSPGARGGSTYGFDEVTEEERLRMELERVKGERAGLLESLTKLHQDQGKSGGELQQDDIRLLRREIEAKQEKLNELRRATQQGMETIQQLETTSRDCEQLVPQGLEPLHARSRQLAEELAAVEADIVEAEAKNELYKLLELRTRRDHQAAEQTMREARELKDNATDDMHVLTRALHETRAAKEDAEQQLGMVVAMYDQVRGDWHAKLKDRRKEVRDLERRKMAESRCAEQEAAAAAERERNEQDKGARQQREQEARDARLSMVAPQLQALEATWASIHTLTGSSTADAAIAYWQELRSKEANMRELVRLAEVREEQAKAEMVRLLEARAEVFDGTGESARPTIAGEGGTAATSTGPAALAAESSGRVLNEKAQQIVEARRRKQTAKKNFHKLSQVCVAAEQGLQLLSERLKAAMSRSAVPSGDGGPSTDRRRTSITNGRRGGGARRPSVVGVRRLSAVGFMERRQSQHTVLLDTAAAVDIAIRVPAGSTIHDKDFFPDLLTLVGSVGSQLEKLLALEAQLEAADAMAREAGVGASSLQPSECSEADPPGSTGGSKRLHWAVRATTPRVDEGEEQVADGEEQETAPRADGEAQLRKGYRRRTWAGPAWVDVVTGKVPPTALLARKAAVVGGGNQNHTYGYVQEPASGDEQGKQHSYGFGSSDSEGEDVLDRSFVHHRSAKLVQSAAKAKQAAAEAAEAQAAQQG